MKLLDKNNNYIKIENEDLNDAKLSSKDFADKSVSKRAFINVLAARLAIKMLFSKKLEASNAYSLYTINNIMKNYDLSDVYLNDIKIDVRLIFNRNEIFIPKSHFKNEILPDLYVVLELKKDFTEAEYLGFFEPKNLDKNNQNKDYYFYDYANLNAPGDIKDFLSNFTANHPKISEKDFEQAEQLFLQSSDGVISTANNLYMLKQLKNSRALREKFVEFENFEMISKVTATDETIFNDSVFDIIGAQSVFEDEELNLQESKAEIIDEVLTDMLDEEIGSSFSKTKQEDDDDLSFLEELESELDETSSKSNNNALEIGGKALAAGAGIAGIAAISAMAATASAAEVQGSLAKASADVIAKGVEAGSAVIENTASAIGNAIPKTKVNNDFESSEFNFDEPNSSFDDGNLLNSLPELDLDELKVFTDEPEINSFEVKSSPNNEFNVNELNKTLEDITEPKNNLSSLANASFKIIDDTEDELKSTGFNYETIEEIEPETNDLSASEELSFDEIKMQTEALTDLDLDLGLNVDTDVDLDENPFSLMKSEHPLENKTDDILEEVDFNNKFMIIEDEEPAANSNEDELLKKINQSENEEASADAKNKDMDMDIDFEVDDFLKNIDIDLSEHDSDFSGDDSTLLADTLSLLGEDSTGDFKTVASGTSISTKEGNVKNNDLQMLFEGELDSEIANIKDDAKIPSSIKKDKKMVIAATVASIVLVSLVIGGSVLHNKNKATNIQTNMATTPISAEGQAPAELGTASGETDTTEQDQQALAPDLNAPEQQTIPDGPQAESTANRDMGQAVSDVFSSEPVSSNISKIAWEVPEDLAYNDGFRSYLQVAGKNLKLNLQNDLLLATEMAYNNKVVVDLGIGKDGSLLSAKVVTSSGSKQIDKIVLRSVNETLKYLRMPASELGGRSAEATLIINF